MGNTVSTLGSAMESGVTRSYHSLSGTDIRAVIGHLTFAEVHAISYSIHRGKVSPSSPWAPPILLPRQARQECEGLCRLPDKEGIVRGLLMY